MFKRRKQCSILLRRASRYILEWNIHCDYHSWHISILLFPFKKNHLHFLLAISFLPGSNSDYWLPITSASNLLTFNCNRLNLGFTKKIILGHELLNNVVVVFTFLFFLLYRICRVCIFTQNYIIIIILLYSLSCSSN